MGKWFVGRRVNLGSRNPARRKLALSWRHDNKHWLLNVKRLEMEPPRLRQLLLLQNIAGNDGNAAGTPEIIS